jgi:hypothetical protein
LPAPAERSVSPSVCCELLAFLGASPACAHFVLGRICSSCCCWTWRDARARLWWVGGDGERGAPVHTFLSLLCMLLFVPCVTGLWGGVGLMPGGGVRWGR